MKHLSIYYVLGLAVSLAACDRNRGERRDIDSARPEVPDPTLQAPPPAPQADPALRTPEQPEQLSEGAAQDSERREAEAEFRSAEGSNLEGKAKLEQVAAGVRVRVEVENAPPGKLGIHIHQKGDCSDIRGESMGTHFSPRGHSHGLPGSPERHAGDLGNIAIADTGEGQLELVAPGVNLRPADPMSFLNRAIVIHEREDTGAQPTGDAGKPIACAVIRADD